jgi:hypothetical protein
MSRSLLHAPLSIFLLASGCVSSAPDAPPELKPGERLGGIRDVPEFPPETPAAREARHARVAKRRAGIPILLHRGAYAFAPENTLEACAASLDHGADGNEIDIFRTKDGVLVLNHDEAIDRTLDGGGKVPDLTYYELLGIPYRDPKGADGKRLRMPTFAAFLLLARERAMLIHLDIKAKGIDGEIARMLSEADLWDHVVVVNDYNSAAVTANPNLKRLPYKGWFEEMHRKEREAIEKLPGLMIFTKKDPTPAVKAMERAAPEKPEPIPAAVYRAWTPEGPRQ